MTTSRPGWGTLVTAPMWGFVWAPIALITLLHYGTGAGDHHVWIHDIARRLYYLPIIGGAFIYGARGALAAALVTVVIYSPHAFMAVGMGDPARGVEKALEILLYLTVASVTGLLVDRERSLRRRQEQLSARLQAALGDRERMEDQLIRSGRLTALGELTAGIAHEIRNPLHALRGTAEIVGDDLPPGGPAAEMWTRHLQEIDRLGQVLDRFLAFARPSQPDLVPLDPAEVVRRTLQLVDAQARRESTTLHINGLRGGCIIRGDEELLTQVCLGIVLNALQSLKEAGGPSAGEITLEGDLGDVGVYVIRVSNNGPPIPEALRERIFDPFFTTRALGTGLGLSIAARIVDMHGGHIQALNAGAPSRPTFEIHLPLASQ